MAIVPLSKITLYGVASQKPSVVDALQELGCVHLVDLSGDGPRKRPVADVSVETHRALKFLLGSPTRRRPVKSYREFRLEEVVQEAGRIEQRQGQLRQERDELVAAMETLQPWGDFQLPEEGELGELQLWFYAVPHYRLLSLADRDLTWQVVCRDHRFAYVVVVSPSEPEEMPAPRVDVDPRPLSELSKQLERIDGELEELHWQRVTLTRWRDCIQRSIALADDQAARRHAAQLAVDDPHLFALRGWAPTRELDRLRRFAADRSLALTIEPPAADDSPPTLLENPPLTAGGQEAVTFYITPAYHAWDPSGIVFVSLSIFFAMIMADAGYALVLGGLLFALWRKLGRTSGRVRVRKLAVAVVVASIAYGVLVGSYFGRPAPSGWLLDRLHVMDAADTDLMMRVSIIVGVVHLALANLSVAWLARWRPQMLSPLGWIAVLFGGLALGLGESGSAPGEELVLYGGWTMAGGLAAILLFSSDRPWRTAKLSNHGWRLAEGGMALAKITRAFGDVLSYLRLFALGLASTQLAVTFNELTSRASASAGIGTLLAILVVVFGHGMNLALAVMGGVVHGLRLNCIEFFGWGLTDEGYPYQPLRRKAT